MSNQHFSHDTKFNTLLNTFLVMYIATAIIYILCVQCVPPCTNTNVYTVIIHYIGHGKKKTGDWCFSDGFITLREILDLYMSNTHFKGRILSIVSDCSYSGSWVKECMEFMDEQGVGPCGHVAKEKGILVELYASCLSFETSVEMAFSAHCAKNDKNTGTLSFGLPASLSCAQQIHECQHPSGINSTQVGCKNKIDEPCTMAPGSTWQRWSAGTRVWLVTSNDNIQPEWSYVLFVDDEQTMCSLINKKIAENIEDCGQVLKSGWGEEPPSEVIEWIEKNYKVDYNYTS